MDISDNNNLSTKEKGRYAQGRENRVKNRFYPCHCLFIVLNRAKPKKKNTTTSTTQANISTLCELSSRNVHISFNRLYLHPG